MEETVKSYAEELREQAIEDALIRREARIVVELVNADNVSINDAIRKIKIEESHIEDVRFLAEKELQKTV